MPLHVMKRVRGSAKTLFSPDAGHGWRLSASPRQIASTQTLSKPYGPGTLSLADAQAGIQCAGEKVIPQKEAPWTSMEKCACAAGTAPCCTAGQAKSESYHPKHKTYLWLLMAAPTLWIPKQGVA